jgi:hypothetical protein
MPRPPKLVTLLAALVVTVVGVVENISAAPIGASSSPVGRDVSFPQCGTPLPPARAAAFGVVGTTGGTVFSKNPCLVEQLRWARQLAGAPAFYANTGNPGPVHSHHWPLGQTAPRVCTRSNPNSLGCSFDYGWNAAVAAYSNAVDAVQTLHHVSRPNARSRAADVDWWLDVEILNSWQALDNAPTAANRHRDTESLAGAVNALWSFGVHRVGIYATQYQWSVVTGGRAITGTRFSANPVWLAGFSTHAHAARACSRAGFTGGTVLLTQFPGRDGFDADVRCL